MTPLEALRARIEHTGPIGVDEYMVHCLHDPEWGYYATRPALGAEGDFITAPLISQMFGELIGLWAVEVWTRLGSPSRVLLVEVGPGDGTLMLDMLRAARVAPAFLEAAEVWFVEPSVPLRERQRGRFGYGPFVWTETLAGVDADAPVILLGNEVLDCMPARQLQRTERGWAERRVALHVEGALRLALHPVELTGAPDAPVGAVLEFSEQQGRFAQEIARRVLDQGGCALLIDYGRAEPEPGDTLQALRRHQKVDPLAAPGECDLTVWAEFDVVADAARQAGAAVAGPITQNALLGRLGIEARAERLSRARPDQAAVIHRQLHRLTHPDQMGELFKAIAIFPPGDPVPPAFETAA